MSDMSTALTILGVAIGSKPVIEVTADALKKMSGPSADIIGHALALPLEQWRKRRIEAANRVVAEAAQLLDDSGSAAREVPGRILWPLLESASLADEEEMIQRWARLLANAGAAKPEVDVIPAYIEILKQLRAIDVAILTNLYKYTGGSSRGMEFKIQESGEVTIPYPFKELYEPFGLTALGAGLVDMNLRRLGLIQVFQEETAFGILQQRPRPETSQSETFTLVLPQSNVRVITSLGWGLVQACSPPPDQNPNNPGKRII